MTKRTGFLAIIIVLIISGCKSINQSANSSPSTKMGQISFSDTDANPLYQFYYSDTLNHEYLRELRQSYKLDSLTANSNNEFEKIKTILNWTTRQWKHNGSNTPSNPDALTILKEARNGKRFRCVEYGIVTSAALNSIGITARVIGLKTKNIEKIRSGGGHVASEVYSTDFEKWIFVDPQFNVIPMLNGMPLNAVEFQNVLINDRVDLKLVNAQGEVSSKESNSYMNWIAKYLFYFDSLFDQRRGNEPNYKEINGMIVLTLVPVREKEPKVFQRHSNIDYSYYTNSINDFYGKPLIEP